MTTQCLGNKKNGARCTARTSNANGYCFQHQAQVPPVPPVPAPVPAPAPAATNLGPWPWIIGALLTLTLIGTVIGLFFHRITVNVPAQQPPVINITLNAPTPLPTTQPTLAATQPAATPQTWSYPLSGQTYSSPQGVEYGAVWTSDGRLWQPLLPSGNLRVAHTVAITIEEGSYAFDGVECQLFVDSSRNGQGASNPVTAKYGNDLHFTVDTADGGQAWGLVECRGNFSSGFQIRYLGQ